MKKFEIINNRWIRKLVLKEGFLYSAVKISSINQIYSFTIDGGESLHLNLHDESGANIDFLYSKTEHVQYKEDLAFFENLLYLY
jgi:hypothetical protein